MARTATNRTVDLSPPKNVAQAAARGLKLREQHGRGGTAIGVARARDLSAQKSLSAQTMRRMQSYFARHSVDKDGKGWADAKAPSAGYIAWLLWGGDAGQRWAERVLRQLDEPATANKSTSARKSASATAGGGKKAATKKSEPKKAFGKAVAKRASSKATVSKQSVGKKSESTSVVRKAAKKTATKKTAAKKTTAKKTTAKKTVGRKTASKKVPAKKAGVRKSPAKKRVTARGANTRGAKKAAPWTKPNPIRKSASTSLSPAQKTKAKKRAKAAGRPYPNLVDNMAVASKRNSAGRANKSSTKKRAAAKK